MTADARRALLSSRANRGGQLDYVVTLDGRLTGGAQVTLRYVPDRLVLDAHAFASYLASLDAPSGIEELAVGILADINDVLVPRWLHIAVVAVDGDHHVVVEDRQPRWSNTLLLQRLERL